MGAEGISKDAFNEMIRQMDKDGDGTVDKVCASPPRVAISLRTPMPILPVLRGACRVALHVIPQDEFKAVYMAMFEETKPDEYEAIWKRIDADGDGNLTVKELASFYGFAWDDSEGGTGTAAEMTDEQILEALQVARHA